MALAERRANAVWEGSLTGGGGTVSVDSGVLQDQPITWAARTEKPNGRTSPEELIAAAHASCFAMALSHTLSQQGHEPERLAVSAVCTLDESIKISRMDLSVRGRVPGIDAATFEQAAKEAGNSCPVSGALKNSVEIHVTAELE